MAILAPAAEVIAPGNDDQRGPLVPFLLVATMVTGLIDAISYLSLGHVFVANMTGNVIFLGFAVADAKDFSVAASLVALAAFLAGALAGGWLGSIAWHHRARLLAIATFVNIVLIGAALVVFMAASGSDGTFVNYALIVLLALAMGLQSATARGLGVADMTTTVLTMTLTGLAADSTPVGGKNPNPGRRLAATVTMLLGAAIGAILIFRVGASAVLALALTLLVCNGIAAYQYSSSSAAWTAGK
jgi:uncharacterized membrane protein YoaK (UPF0700 family)